MKTIILILAAIPVLLFTAYFIISALIYMAQEVNHSVRKMHRYFKEFCWDVEWKIKHWR